MKAPCALLGAQLPGASPDEPMVIHAALMRGVESQGMLCSARELGLTRRPQRAAGARARRRRSGATCASWLQLDDHVFTLKLTPNRRRLPLHPRRSAGGGCADAQRRCGPLRIEPVAARHDATFPVRISAPAGCGRFTGRVIRNVDARATTPDWMRQRLERAGQRCISPLVDVTNYVMLELGRPLHVYDLAKLRGAIDVRFGRRANSLKLLNEQTVEMDDDVLAITDDSGPIGLAGIMGGESTKADETTRNMFLEAAFFFPDAIAGRARRYNFAQRRLAPLRARRRLRQQRDRDRARDAADPARSAAASPGRWRTPSPVCRSAAGAHAGGARAAASSACHVPRDEIGAIFARLALPATLRAKVGRSLRGHPAVIPLRHRDRGGPDRGSRAGLWLRAHPREPPRVPAAMLQPAGGPALPARAAGGPGRRRIPGSDQLQLRRASLGGRFGRLRRPDPPAQSDRQPALGHAHEPDRRAAWPTCATTINRKVPRVRVFEVGRVFLRDPGAQEGPLDVAGIRQPMRVAAAAFGRPPPSNGAWRSVPSTSSTSKADLEALLAPLHARFEPASHPALHPGRCARVLLDGGRLAGSASCIRRWQQKYELPEPPWCVRARRRTACSGAAAAYREVVRVSRRCARPCGGVRGETPVQAVLDGLHGRKSGHRAREHPAVRSLPRRGRRNREKKSCFPGVIARYSKNADGCRGRRRSAAVRQRLQERFGGKLRQ